MTPGNPMAERLEDLLRECAVQVIGERSQGAGFFVAPGKVMTCVHVIGDRPGLRHDPDNAYLHAVLGQVYAAEDAAPAALAAYDQALAADPGLQAAWAGQAEVLFETGDREGAIASLDRALAISEDAAILFNRAVALQGS